MSTTDVNAEAVAPSSVSFGSAPTGVDIGLPAFRVRASKLHPIAARAGGVRRTALLDRLEGSIAPVVTVVAPAGYGKTTLLTQWSEHARNQPAWLSADDAENDAAV